MRPSPTRSALKVALIYTAAMAVCLALSRPVIRALVRDRPLQDIILMVDAWAAVAVVGLILFLERRRAEEKLRYHAGLLEDVSDAVIACDLDFRIRSWSRAAEKMYGWRADEVLGKPLPPLVETQFSKGTREDAVRRLLTDGYWESEVRQRVKGGEHRDFFIHLKVIPGRTGRPIGVVGINRDITEWKRNERALLESNRTLKTLIQSSPLAIQALDPEGRVRLWNPAAERMFGWTEAEVLGQPNPIASADPDIQTRFERLNDSVLGGRIVTGMEKTRRRKDGSAIEISAALAPLEDGQGRISGTVVIMADVTGRKRAEEALRTSEQRFRQLADNISIAFWLLSPDENELFYVSPAFETIMDVPSGELYANTRAWITRLHPEDQERVRAIIGTRQCRVDATVRSREFRVIRSDGRIGWVWTRSWPVFDGGGGVVARAGVAEDITERKLGEVALQESQRFVQKIADSIPSILYVFDLSERRITYINRAVRNILGYPPDEVVRREDFFKSILDPAGGDEWLYRIDRLGRAEDGDIVETEFRLKHRDGDYRWLSARETVFERDPDGQPRRILGAALDVTENRRLQEQVIHSQKMESVGRLAGGVAHDFNNLLTVILGSVELMAAELPAASPLQRNIEDVRKAAGQASGLTHQLLAFARRQITAPRNMNLGTLVREGETMLRRLIRDDIDLRVEEEPELWMVKADPGQMMQVLVNMVVNARDAMPGGGTVTVRLANATVAGEASREMGGPVPGEYVTMSVSDTGLGMSPEVRDRLFEPFFTTKDVGQGTGLGLATCYGIVRQSDGTIHVSSIPGEGSRFTVYLPRHRSRIAGPSEITSAGNEHGGSETILFVEDNAPVRQMVTELLERRGYVVLGASGGQEALDVARRCPGPIHLLLTDMVMPRMNGRELAERLKEIRPGVKVLFTSGYTEDEFLRHGVRREELALLQKPFTSETLMKRIREVLETEAVTGGLQGQDSVPA